MRSTAAKFTAAVTITVVLALSGTGTALAQPGSQFQTQTERQSEGLRGYPYNRRRTTYRAPSSGQLARTQAIETCTAQGQAQVPGSNYEARQQRYFLYLSCMNRMGQRP
jgi:hypothetical protein